VAEAKRQVPPEALKRQALAAEKGHFVFENAIKKEKMAFICECKKASPSKGLIAPDFPYLQIAKEYEAAGADCISVLTEPKCFLGDNRYLQEIAQTVGIPCLRKDFTVDEYMIYEAKCLGAKAVLLICSILSEEQIGTFMEAIKQEEIWRDFFYLELMTGLREGEICALKWSDFDAEAGKLAVSRTLHSDGTTGETKTYSGMRSIKLPESAAEMLRERKKTALTEWIFPNPLKPEKAVLGSAAYNRLKKILKKCGLPNIRFHDLRHTFATQAIAGGVDPKSLSHLLGHTKASFSLDRYTHVTTEMQESAAATMGSFLDKIIGKEVDGWAEEKTAREA
jgi:hypothetical protein